MAENARLPPQQEQASPPSSHPRTPSSSSLDSSFRSSPSSFSEEFPPFSPSSTKGVPFSWEQIPGIPKPQISSHNQPSSHLLPLPPAGNPNPTAKKPTARVRRDPFIAALKACSKDDHEDHQDHDHGSLWKDGFKITRSLSDRFGFINVYASCKRTCAVSESIVYLPRSSSHYLLTRRSS